MGFQSLVSLCILSLISSSSVIFAQQPYVRKATNACENTDNSTSVLGYTCNGLSKTCQSYLIFRSKPPYNTVSSISGLLAADPSQLSQINSVSESATFETNKQVIVPVNCSCSGEYYQANASYVVEPENTYFIIANDIYQGLSTCQALQNQSNIAATNLSSGTRITVPLRCACPTKDQIDEGVNYLLSYTVDWGDSVPSVSLRFGVDTGRTLEANELSEVDSTIYPFTTLLIPLQNPPSNSQTMSPPPPPPSPPPPSSPSPSGKSSNKNWVYVVIGVVAGGTLLLVIGATVFCIFFRKRKRKADPIIMSKCFEGYEKPLNKKMEEESEEFLESISDIAQSLIVYKFQELKAATENFSPKCWIKGSVYRGTINGNFAAIKKMNGDVSKEINLLNKINHFNLIRLSGVCFSQGNWYLVYEYAVNGPLSDWIYYKEGGPKILSWTQRIQIALDVATGLNYLHCYTNPPHVHKDIRSSNVLLDSDFRAKIANFGLARSAQGQEGQFALTRHIIGTKGYMAPEYLENGLVSPKLDVYAFGILMLEILTGKEAAVLNGGQDVHLSEVLIVVHHEENAEEKLRDFIDPSLQGNYPLELALLMARLIESCLRKDPSSRLSMDEIVQSVSRILTTSQAWELSNNGSRKFGQYYQANAAYVILSIYDTYFTIANDTYQGLPTCDSLVQQNAYDALSLLPGLELRVPLRCACPTFNQIENGTNNLLTYLVSWNHNVPDLSERFNVSRKSILDAYGFSEQDPTLFPFSTILIPLATEPSSSQTIIHYPPVISPPYTSIPLNRRPKKGLYVSIGIATGCSLLVLCVVLPVAFLRHKKKRSEEGPWNYGEGKRKQVLPGDLLVSIASLDQVLKQLTDDNYNSWKRAMVMALTAKNKIGFVDGSLTKPANSSDPLTSIIYIDTAAEMWTDLHDRFSQHNGPRIFQLQKAISSLSQENDSVSTYFTSLKGLWDELGNHQPVPSCTCDLVDRSIASMNKVFSLVLQEERQRTISVSSTSFNQNTTALLTKVAPPNRYANSKAPQNCKDRPTCAHCGITGHTIEKCYKLHGFPPGYKFNKGKNISHTANQVSESDSPQLPITYEQCQQLMNMFKPPSPEMMSSAHQVSSTSSQDHLISNMADHESSFNPPSPRIVQHDSSEIRSNSEPSSDVLGSNTEVIVSNSDVLHHLTRKSSRHELKRVMEKSAAHEEIKASQFEELKAATDNFSPKSRMKGSVYRGVFNGKVLAIKRMKIDASKEVNILNRINHSSLIKLHGACEEHGCSNLVYECMENGSLRDWLHRKSCPQVQSWTRRVKIALDIANGLHYLHNFTYPAYMHRDIKSSSDLLDGDLRAKISNFSLARAEERGASGYAFDKACCGNERLHGT
ncbi:hypothetical protein HHK36_031937 [Tetracentron sinense]|uniref:Uncharacterized protein n=1 Tax=Tetracentron sinense TaxID=13715 RepID=A0A834YB63_TETSI|nr:hypothetical protein HHK36_031937 [Tetracentron sinense]